MAGDVKAATRALSEFNKKAEEVLSKRIDMVTRRAEEFKERDSEMLYGVVGGVSGVLVSLGVEALAAAFPFVLASGPLAVLGVAAGVLVFRRRMIPLEQALRKAKAVRAAFRNEIDELREANAPDDLIEERWRSYRQLCAATDERTSGFLRSRRDRPALPAGTPPTSSRPEDQRDDAQHPETGQEPQPEASDPGVVEVKRA